MEDRQTLNRNLAQMLKGGVIMDVTTPEQARIAETAGACAVMALERIPADIRAAGGVSRMSDPKMIKGIQEAVSIPVMAKCRIGHFVEAQILEAIEIDYIDESEVLSPADDVYHIDKRQFKVPFVCGAKDLGEALRREFETEHGVDMMGVISRVYRMPQPNRWLASLSPFIHRHLDNPHVRDIVRENFRQFLVRNIIPYRRPDLSVSFVGSIAYYYADILRETIIDEGLSPGIILLSPFSPSPSR